MQYVFLRKAVQSCTCERLRSANFSSGMGTACNSDGAEVSGAGALNALVDSTLVQNATQPLEDGVQSLRSDIVEREPALLHEGASELDGVIGGLLE